MYGRHGRPRKIRPFLHVQHQKEGIPFEVQYLTAADELVFYSNTNSNRYSLSTGEYITKLPNLKRLTISAYGLTELDPSFKNLKSLEFLDLSGNNFEEIPSVLTKENLPNLHALKMNANQRIIIYDLYNSTTTNFGGLFQETSSSREFPRRLLEWGQARHADPLGELPPGPHSRHEGLHDLHAGRHQRRRLAAAGAGGHSEGASQHQALLDQPEPSDRRAPRMAAPPPGTRLVGPLHAGLLPRAGQGQGRARRQDSPTSRST